jgi:hypothetical protein
MINEGIIQINSESAKELGFTSDKFDSGSYLWREGNTIIISLITGRVKGSSRNLIQTIQGMGFDFEIPTPSNRMREIAEKQGWNSYRKLWIEVGQYVEIITNKQGGEK